jgi:hypothetical protein
VDSEVLILDLLLVANLVVWTTLSLVAVLVVVRVLRTLEVAVAVAVASRVTGQLFFRQVFKNQVELRSVEVQVPEDLIPGVMLV